MPTGIKYLKIAKIDATGVDRSDSLRYLNTFRLSFTDLGLVTFLVIDRIEYSNYFQFTVNPITSLPGGAITSSDNRIYNYTSSIPDGNIPSLPTVKLGSLTQALEITDLALSGGYSNWDDYVSATPSEAKDEFNGSTVYGEYQILGSTVDFGYDRFSNPSYNWDDVVGLNPSYAYPQGLETSTFLFNRLEAAGEFVNISESIELPPQLTLITSSGNDYGTNIRINRTPNTVVPFSFTVAWCNVDRATANTNFYQAYKGITPSSASSIPSPPLGNINTNYYPGKVYLGCYKNGTLQNYATSSIISQSAIILPTPNNNTAIVQYTSSLNELNVVKGDELSFKLFGYSNYASNGLNAIKNSIIVGKLSGSTCVEGFTGFTNAPPAISESFRNATQTPNEVFAGPPSASLVSPFLSIEEFSNSGADVLMNNVDSYPPNPFLQDLDYNSSQTVPVNYEAVLNNTATKATVPESNYTQLSSTNIRYNGSKYQTEKLNEWTNTEFNIGNYGKEPSIESRENLLTYCTSGGGLPPEYMDAIEVRIKYIIKNADNITSPNVSEEAIGDVQFAYPSDGIVTLVPVSEVEGAGAGQNFKIIRGGQRVLPVFYNQFKHSGDLAWEDEINVVEFTSTGAGGTVIDDLTATLGLDIDFTSPNASSPSTYKEIPLDKKIFAGNNTPGTDALATLGSYEITQELLDAISTVNFYCVVNVGLSTTSPASAPENFDLVLYKNASIFDGIYNTTVFEDGGDGINNINAVVTYNRTFNPTELTVGDIFEFKCSPSIFSFFSDNYDFKIFEAETPVTFPPSSVELPNLGITRWEITQNPIPTPPISTIGLFFTSSIDPYTLYSTSSQFYQYYENQLIKQENIANSGFFGIEFPIEFEAGDQVRFEGLETNVFEVISAAKVPDTFAEPSVEIKLNKQISGSGIDVNEFVFRRFINDGGAITVKLDGQIPPTAPYYAFPEFITDELSTELDTLTSTLVNKGLIE